jgi:DNA replication protein DnaC
MAASSRDDIPLRIHSRPARIDPEEAVARFRALCGDFRGPTLPEGATREQTTRDGRQDAGARLLRTVPPAYRWARFDAPEMAARVGSALGRARERALWRQPRIVFTGRAGTGKTSLAVACLRQWVDERAAPAVFAHAYALATARLQHPAGHGEPEVVERAMTAPLTLLDDLGSERDSAGSAAPEVVFVRHAENRPLWVTTGLTRPQLVARYGEGIVRRLFERATIVSLGTADNNSSKTRK